MINNKITLQSLFNLKITSAGLKKSFNLFLPLIFQYFRIQNLAYSDTLLKVYAISKPS